MIAARELQPLIASWLPTQRWFGGKGRDASVELSLMATVQPGPPEVSIWCAQVRYADDTVETYQLPLVCYPKLVESLEHVLVGTVDDADGTTWIYDALHDKDATQAWLLGIRDGRDSGLRYIRYVDPVEVPVGEPSLALTGEQSNTSLVFGDAAIMKVFRRLAPGVNPDIEVHAALAERGAKHVARLFGSVHGELDGGTCALAMLQEFLTTATDGWELAKASVRDLMAEADLHAEEAGGDFAGEAWRLGQAVAQVHQDLAAAFGHSTVAPDVVRTRVADMRDRLDRAVAVVPELDEIAAALHKTYDQLGAVGTDVAVQRIHGDLHLGQVLRTAHRWVVIDFEGEPMKPLEERLAFDSPLRDIAGMLRSFEYAGHYRVVEAGFAPQLLYRAMEWTERNRDAFCQGYAEAIGADPREQDSLLRAYEADKAVYEAVYEARNRPSWLPIPLASLTRLAEEGASG